MSIHVAGGVYREVCMHPPWDETFGSAGRAASALAAMGTQVLLHAYLDPIREELTQIRAALTDNFSVQPIRTASGISFYYDHDLATPVIHGIPKIPHLPLRVEADNVIRFGILEGDAVVNADYAVYDPQNMGAVVAFDANGSHAAHLALILNQSEARMLSGLSDCSASDCATALAERAEAEVVVVKMGPRGAFVWSRDGSAQIPAYRTPRVWKIGSGDCFVAHFSNAWMNERQSPIDAAITASKATAYYCETQGFPTPPLLARFTRPEVSVSDAYRAGKSPKVYLAGPFFNLPQRWMIEQARVNLTEAGLKVFSPFHDVGLGGAEDVVHKDLQAIRECDLMFAIVDGLDPGTVYEIGYARSLGKPVIVYSECESEQNTKMPTGSGCIMCNNYTTAVYSALWEAVKL